MSEDGKHGMSADKYDEFRIHREEFLEAFRNEDQDMLNSVLDELPENQIEGDDDNDPRRRILWKDCPIRMTAGYYASNKMNEMEMPIPEIPELKALLDAAKKETSS